MSPPAASSPAPSSPRRWALAILAAVGAVFALALALRACRATAADAAAATGDAEWIWAAVAQDRGAPLAFWAAVDFDLATVPAAAELCALADEEYLLYLNGRRVGSNLYAPGAPLDVYEVGPLLRPGANRLAAELRSSRGNGGFLASLRDPASGRRLAATGGGWRVIEAEAPGVVDGALPDGVPARSWGRPPTGRWGTPSRGPRRPLFAAAAVGGRTLPQRYTPVGGPPVWHPYERDRIPVFHLAERWPGVLFDFGREVHGYVVLRAARPAPRPAALLFTGELPFDPLAVAFAGGDRDPPAAAEAGAEAAAAEAETAAGVRRLTGLAAGAPVLTVPGRRNWADAVPRRFRYVAVVGMPEVNGAWAFEVAEAAAAGLPAPPEPRVAGVFGLAPPPLRSPVEDEVWRQLQRLARQARREGR